MRVIIDAKYTRNDLRFTFAVNLRSNDLLITYE